jgi:hypothetical protein
MNDLFQLSITVSVQQTPFCSSSADGKIEAKSGAYPGEVKVHISVDVVYR